MEARTLGTDGLLVAPVELRLADNRLRARAARGAPLGAEHGAVTGSGGLGRNRKRRSNSGIAVAAGVASPLVGLGALRSSQPLISGMDPADQALLVRNPQ